MTTTVPKAAADEINEWVRVMLSSEFTEMAAKHGEPVLSADPADLVAAALDHFSADYLASQNAVGDAIDRVAALRWSNANTSTAIKN